MTAEPNPFATRCGGIREASEQKFAAVLGMIEADKAARAADMPTERDAIDAMCRAVQRLEDMGWRTGPYYPKDGSIFDVIEVGSSAIHAVFYSGEWPKGRCFTVEDGGWPSTPALFRARLPSRREDALPLDGARPISQADLDMVEHGLRAPLVDPATGRIRPFRPSGLIALALSPLLFGVIVLLWGMVG